MRYKAMIEALQRRFSDALKNEEAYPVDLKWALQLAIASEPKQPILRDDYVHCPTCDTAMMHKCELLNNNIHHCFMCGQLLDFGKIKDSRGNCLDDVAKALCEEMSFTF